MDEVSHGALQQPSQPTKPGEEKMSGYVVVPQKVAHLAKLCFQVSVHGLLRQLRFDQWHSQFH